MVVIKINQSINQSIPNIVCWEINNFVMKSDSFRRFFICKNILKKLSCYHDNCFRYFMFGKYIGFVSKARISACIYFLVYTVAVLYGLCPRLKLV